MRDLPLRSFASFLIAFVTPWIYKPDSLRDLTIFIILIFSFEIISAVVRSAKSKRRTDPKIFIQIAPPVVDPAASKPIENRILLVNGLRTLFIKSKPVFSNGPRSLLINPYKFLLISLLRRLS